VSLSPSSQLKRWEKEKELTEAMAKKKANPKASPEPCACQSALSLTSQKLSSMAWLAALAIALPGELWRAGLVLTL
jgi:hypothetical protein